MDAIELRAHHLLCALLFKGKGYSEEFVSEMSKTVAALRGAEDIDIILRDSPDVICRYCPNNTGSGGCALDNEASDKRTIDSLDNRVLRFFKLAKDVPTGRSAVFAKLADAMTEEFFNSCCRSCRWYEMGLCSYNMYISELTALMKSFE